MHTRDCRWIAGMGALGVLVLITLIAYAADSSADVMVGFNPVHTYMTYDPDLAPVSVMVDAGAMDLKGFSLVIEFDSTFVIPFTVTAGSLLTNAGCDYFFEWRNDGSLGWEPGIGDSVFVDGALLGDCSVAGPGELFQIMFAKPNFGYGMTELTCRNDSASFPRMRDSQNDSLFVTCEPGTISAPIHIENMTWGRIKAEYRGP